MDGRHSRNLFVVAVAGVLCLLSTSIVSAQTATNLNCNGCVGKGEVANNTVSWFNLDGVARAYLINQANTVNGFDARLAAVEATIAALQTPATDLTSKTYCMIGQGIWLSANGVFAGVAMQSSVISFQLFRAASNFVPTRTINLSSGRRVSHVASGAVAHRATGSAPESS